MRQLWFRFVRTVYVLLAGFGCAPLANTPHHSVRDNITAPTTAVVHLQPTEGNLARGTVQLERRSDGTVHVVAELSGLTPGEHGFHVHQGDCSAADASSAGEHVVGGDLPNLVAGPDGRAKLDVVESTFALQGNRSVVGRSIVVHEEPGPTPRIACGVIVAESWRDITDLPPPPASVRADDIPGANN